MVKVSNLTPSCIPSSERVISNARNEGSVYNVAVNPESGTVAVGTSKSRLAAHDGDVLILVFGKSPSLCCGFVRFFETFFSRKIKGRCPL